MTGVFQDLRYALRQLRKSPGFATVAIATLALGIGANTAIFSIANGVLLRDLPYQDPQRLALLWNIGRGDDNRDQLSFTDIDDYRSQNDVFENVVAFGNWSATFTGAGDPARIPGMQVGNGYLSLMRVQPMLGRDFLPDEQIEGKDQVIILTYGLWQSRFAGDPQVVGRQISLSGRPYTIIGVTPKDFPMLPTTLVDGPAQFYRPVAEKHDDKERLSRHLRAMARLKPGVTVEQAQSDLEVINHGLAKQFPDEYSTTGVRVVKLRDDIAAGLRPALWMLLGAIGFLLLIACANLSNLLLVRGIGRQKEVAIRSALGADRARIVQYVLTESVLLALCGGMVGILLAFWSTKFIVTIGTKVIPQLVGVSLDGRVLAFTAGLSLATGLLFGLVPALRLSGFTLSDALKEGARSSGAAHDTFRKVLAVSEIALSLVLLAGAGLLLRSFSKLYGVDPGFRSDHLLTMDIGLPSAKYLAGTEKPLAFYRELLGRINALPGVESAGAVNVLPLGTNFDTAGTEPEGFVHGPGETPYPERYIVTPGYLAAVGIRLVRGRLFSDADRESAPLVVLISDTAAERWWPNQDPIGRRIKVPGFDVGAQPWRTVVGVVRDVKQAGLDAPQTMQIYLPHAQYRNGYLTLVVRTKSDPMSLAAEVRRQVMQVDPEQAVSNIATMDQVLSDSIVSRRFSATLLGILAGLGLLLAAIGVYGVISYGVSQRTREIGIRIALGAKRKDVLSLVVAQGMKLLLLGVGAGIVSALLLTPALSSLLFGVSPSDPVTFAGSAIFLAAVALFACYIPARRAAKVDPMVALRSE
ncbi:MAG TPA: ABC transporter permease [Terriglobales bacterium]|jgi:putative ABC transport system permease protein|nr:ABC transporter permease [Terriglobales bacterium]